MDSGNSFANVNTAQISLNHGENFGVVGTKLIRVNIGEDIVFKIMDFLQQEEMEISIQSVTGEVCSVSFEEMGGDIVTYESRFHIISLIKSFIVVESSRICGLHVLLSRPDHSVIGGYVFGMRMAATPVEVVVRFIPENEEPGYDDAFKGYDDAPMLIT